MSVQRVLEYGARIMIIFMVIPLHEFAHAWAANKMGDPTPKNQNRLNVNPFNHIDIMGSVLLLFLGFGWGKPVQVNPNYFKNPKKGMALSAAAGPIANVIVAYIGIIIFKVLEHVFYSNPTEVLYWLTLIMYYFTAINLGLAIFNLIPIPPLDGSKILGYFTSYNFNRKIERYSLYISLGFIALVLSGLLDRPLAWLNDGLFWIMDKLSFWVDPLLNSLF